MIPRVSQNQETFKPSALEGKSDSEKLDGCSFEDCLYLENSKGFESPLQKFSAGQEGSFRGDEGEDSFSTSEEVDEKSKLFRPERGLNLKDILKEMGQEGSKGVSGLDMKRASSEINQEIPVNEDLQENLKAKSVSKVASLFQEAAKGKGFKVQKEGSIAREGVDPELILNLQNEEMSGERGFSRDGRERDTSQSWTLDKSSVSEEKSIHLEDSGKGMLLKSQGFEGSEHSAGARIEGGLTALNAWSPQMGVTLVEGAAPTAPVYSPPPVLLPVEQLAFSVRTALQEGVERFKIDMRPPELGRIEAKIEIMKDGSVKAVFTADNPDARDLLRRQADQLAQILNESGFSVDAGDLQFSLKGEGQDPHSDFSGDFEGSRRGMNQKNFEEDPLLETELDTHWHDPNRALDVIPFLQNKFIIWPSLLSREIVYFQES